jgi:hypothetical protein
VRSHAHAGAGRSKRIAAQEWRDRVKTQHAWALQLWSRRRAAPCAGSCGMAPPTGVVQRVCVRDCSLQLRGSASGPPTNAPRLAAAPPSGCSGRGAASGQAQALAARTTRQRMQAGRHAEKIAECGSTLRLGRGHGTIELHTVAGCRRRRKCRRCRGPTAGKARAHALLCCAGSGSYWRWPGPAPRRRRALARRQRRRPRPVPVRRPAWCLHRHAQPAVAYKDVVHRARRTRRAIGVAIVNKAHAATEASRLVGHDLDRVDGAKLREALV